MTRVLVVEDNWDLQQLYAEVLIEAGFDVRTATTADAALAIADEEPIDVVTVDIGKSGGGLALAAALYGFPVRPALIAVTGRPVNAADQRLFDRFMIKPVLPNELVRTVVAVLRDRTRSPRRADTTWS